MIGDLSAIALLETRSILLGLPAVRQLHSYQRNYRTHHFKDFLGR